MLTLYVNKTGMDFFDASVTYGLALLLQTLPEGGGDVSIRDDGPRYVLVEESFPVPRRPRLDRERWLRLFVVTDENRRRWNNVFRTVLRKRPIGKLVTHMKNVLSENLENIIQTHCNLSYSTAFSQKRIKGTEVLIQSLDVSAAKGIRIPKRGLRLGEGSQLYLNEKESELAYLGAVYFAEWIETSDFILSVIPNPTNITVVSHMTIQKDFDRTGICSVSTATAAAHYAVRQQRIAFEKEVGPSHVYGYVIFNAMLRTGQQPKPAGGGRLTLTPLEKLRGAERGGLALKFLDSVFQLRNPSLSVALADFLVDPTLENYRRYSFTHLRTQATGNQREQRILSGLSPDSLNEVLRLVEAG